MTVQPGRVIVVHGLWMNGLETALLRQRLAAQGFSPEVFRYPSTRASLDEVVEALTQRLARMPFGSHVVGHSLGGLMALETLTRRPSLLSGRAVLLGSPVRGSLAAQGLAAWPLGRALLGERAAAELLHPREPRWPGPGELGVLAGTLAAGLGRVVASLPEPNDGTVAVEETGVEGAKDVLTLDVSHTGMLFSHAVADAVGRFLRTGRFGGDAADAGVSVRGGP